MAIVQQTPNMSDNAKIVNPPHARHPKTASQE